MLNMQQQYRLPIQPILIYNMYHPKLALVPHFSQEAEWFPYSTTYDKFSVTALLVQYECIRYCSMGAGKLHTISIVLFY